MEKESERKNLQSYVLKVVEANNTNFCQFLTLIGTCFVSNLKALSASDLDFPPKMSKTSIGGSQPNF